MKRSWELIFSGVGGQGLLLMGSLLGEAAVTVEDRNALMSTDYGTESRGTFTKADLKISDEEIHYPEVLSGGDVVVALAQVAYDRYIDRPGEGVLVYNSDLIIPAPSAGKQLGFPIERLAAEAGTPGNLNMVALGIVVGLTGCLREESVITVIERRFAHRPKVLAGNLDAFLAGVRAAKALSGSDFLGFASDPAPAGPAGGGRAEKPDIALSAPKAAAQTPAAEIPLVSVQAVEKGRQLKEICLNCVRRLAWGDFGVCRDELWDMLDDRSLGRQEKGLIAADLSDVFLASAKYHYEIRDVGRVNRYMGWLQELERQYPEVRTVVLNFARLYVAYLEINFMKREYEGIEAFVDELVHLSQRNAGDEEIARHTVNGLVNLVNLYPYAGVSAEVILPALGQIGELVGRYPLNGAIALAFCRALVTFCCAQKELPGRPHYRQHLDLLERTAQEKKPLFGEKDYEELVRAMGQYELV